MRHPGRDRLILLAVIAVGAMLRWTFASDQPLWGDEALSLVIANYGYGELFFQPVDPTPGLYYAVQKMWAFAGTDPMVVRFPSLVFGVATIPAFYWLGHEAGGPRTGLIAAGLCAVIPEFVDYSGEARAYALLILLLTVVLASILAACRAHEGGKSDRATRFVLIAALASTFALYTHVVAWPFLAPILSLALVHAWRRQIVARRWLAIGVVAMGLVLLPELRRSYLLTQTAEFGWLAQLSLPQFVTLAIGMAGPAPTFFDLGADVVMGGAVSPLFWHLLQFGTIAFWGWVVWFLVIKARGHWTSGTGVMLVAILLAYPLALYALGTIKPLLMPRTLLPWQIGIILAASLAFARCRSGWVVLAAIGAMCAELVVVGTGRVRLAWDEIAEAVASDARSDAVLVCPAWSASAFLYAYADQHPARVEKPLLVVTDARFPTVAGGSTAGADLGRRYFETVWSQRDVQGGAFQVDADRLPAEVLLVESECSADEMGLVTRYYRRGEILLDLNDGEERVTVTRARLRS